MRRRIAALLSAVLLTFCVPALARGGLAQGVFYSGGKDDCGLPLPQISIGDPDASPGFYRDPYTHIGICNTDGGSSQIVENPRRCQHIVARQHHAPCANN